MTLPSITAEHWALAFLLHELLRQVGALTVMVAAPLASKATAGGGRKTFSTSVPLGTTQSSPWSWKVKSLLNVLLAVPLSHAMAATRGRNRSRLRMRPLSWLVEAPMASSERTRRGELAALGFSV